MNPMVAVTLVLQVALPSAVPPESAEASRRAADDEQQGAGGAGCGALFDLPQALAHRLFEAHALGVNADSLRDDAH